MNGDPCQTLEEHISSTTPREIKIFLSLSLHIQYSISVYIYIYIYSCLLIVHSPSNIGPTNHQESTSSEERILLDSNVSVAAIAWTRQCICFQTDARCAHCGKETTEPVVVLVIGIFQLSCFNFQLLLLPLSLSVYLTQSLGCPHGEPQWPWGTGQELHAFRATFTWSADNQVMLEVWICWNPRDSFMKAFQSRRLLCRAL